MTLSLDEARAIVGVPGPDGLQVTSTHLSTGEPTGSVLLEVPVEEEVHVSALLARPSVSSGR